MFKKLFGKKLKMYAVAIKWDDGSITLEKWDEIGLNNLGIYEGFGGYEIIKVMEI